jgi:hypothetical protein
VKKLRIKDPKMLFYFLNVFIFIFLKVFFSNVNKHIYTCPYIPIHK